MKKVLLVAALLGVFVASTASVYAEESIIVSEQLTLSDVRGTVMNEIKRMDKNGSLKELYGIYQSGSNSVEVFWSAVLNGKVEQSSSTILRFTSGQWFNSDLGEFLKK
jgi:hypothetical protein